MDILNKKGKYLIFIILISFLLSCSDKYLHNQERYYIWVEFVERYSNPRVRIDTISFENNSFSEYNIIIPYSLLDTISDSYEADERFNINGFYGVYFDKFNVFFNDSVYNFTYFLISDNISLNSPIALFYNSCLGVVLIEYHGNNLIFLDQIIIPKENRRIVFHELTADILRQREMYQRMKKNEFNNKRDY